MNTNNQIKGHSLAFLTIAIWGTTFISTKILLLEFQPIEILFYRFCIGLILLLVIYPHRLVGTTKKQELLFACAGLCGVTLYYLLENISLVHTTASNAGVIMSVSPFFTAILSNFLLDGERPKKNFFIGFLFAIVGISLISFNGTAYLNLSPLGDILALSAAAVWAVYSILSRKISEFGYNTIQTTRRIFYYGILFMLPCLFIFDFEFGIERLSNHINLFNILFLGIGASALCFVTWNLAVKYLGAIKTSIYIYMVPVITVITSVIILNERITWMSGIGTLLTLTGLFLSEKKDTHIRRK